MPSVAVVPVAVPLVMVVPAEHHLCPDSAYALLHHGLGDDRERIDLERLEFPVQRLDRHA